MAVFLGHSVWSVESAWSLAGPAVEPQPICPSDLNLVVSVSAGFIADQPHSLLGQGGLLGLLNMSKDIYGLLLLGCVLVRGEGLSVEKFTDHCQTKIIVIWDIKREELSFFSFLLLGHI